MLEPGDVDPSRPQPGCIVSIAYTLTAAPARPPPPLPQPLGAPGGAGSAAAGARVLLEAASAARFEWGAGGVAPEVEALIGAVGGGVGGTARCRVRRGARPRAARGELPIASGTPAAARSGCESVRRSGSAPRGAPRSLTLRRAASSRWRGGAPGPSVLAGKLRVLPHSSGRRGCPSSSQAGVPPGLGLPCSLSWC